MKKSEYYTLESLDLSFTDVLRHFLIKDDSLVIYKKRDA